MQTSSLKNNPTVSVTPKLSALSKKSVTTRTRKPKDTISKETLALFGDTSIPKKRIVKNEQEQEPKKSVVTKKILQLQTKTQSKPQIQEKSIVQPTIDKDTLEIKQITDKPTQTLNIQSVATPQPAPVRRSLFSLFTRTKKEESEEESVSTKKNVAEQKVTISEPVKATPVPQRKIENQKKLSTFGLSKERDQFIENLSMLVLSGMSIIGALSSIIKQTKSEGMKKILEQMHLEIEAGSPVWKAFDRTEFFKGYTISLIRLGEESGNFAENLKVVSLEEEKDREFKSKVHSALMYPIFVLTLTLVVGIGISWFILPKLAKIFYDLKLALPLITRVLLAFGLFLNKYGLIAVPLAIFVISIIAYVLFFNRKTKFLGEHIIFSIPGIKTLLMEVEVARFGYLLGTLLEAGLPVTKAIDSLASASEVIRYKKFYLALRENVDMGNSFEKSFALYKGIDNLIPQSFQQLIISGEQSGNLNKTLIKVGQVLEAKSDTTTKNLTIIMEPILLVIVWAGVVSVAFAVILPIYSLVGGLNNI